MVGKLCFSPKSHLLGLVFTVRSVFGRGRVQTEFTRDGAGARKQHGITIEVFLSLISINK
jgi:hypothetical protein